MATTAIEDLLMQSAGQVANASPKDIMSVANATTDATMKVAKAQSGQIESEKDVAIDSAQRAELLQFEMASERTKVTNDVVAMYEELRNKTALGSQSAQANLQEASALDIEAQRLEDAKPSVFKNPLGAIVATFKVSGMREDAQEKRDTAHRVAQDVSNLVQLGRVKLEDTIAANNLALNAKLAQRSAELDKGLAVQRIENQATARHIANADAATQTIAAQKKDAIGWLAQQQQLYISQQDLAMRKKEHALNMAKWNRDEADRAKLDANVADVAYSLAKAAKVRAGNSAAPTEDEVLEWHTAARGLANNDFAMFGRLASQGGLLKRHGTVLGTKEIFERGDVGGIRALGTLTGNAMLKSIGEDLFATEYTKQYDALAMQQFKALENVDATANPTLYQQWLSGLKAPQLNDLKQKATEIARNTVDSMPVSAYQKNRVARIQLTDKGINTTAFGNPQLVQQYYGFAVGSPENTALASKDFLNAVTSAQATASTDATVTGAATAIDWLKQAGIKNPYKVMAKVYAAAHKGELLKSDPQYTMIRQAGLDAPVVANVKLDDAMYDMADPNWLERAVLRYRNPPKTVLGRFIDRHTASKEDLAQAAANREALANSVDSLIKAPTNSLMGGAAYPTEEAIAAGNAARRDLNAGRVQTFLNQGGGGMLTLPNENAVIDSATGLMIQQEKSRRDAALDTAISKGVLRTETGLQQTVPEPQLRNLWND